MSNIIIHIGAPRTGTTVIQKSLLPRSNNHLILQKDAYAMSGESLNNKTPYIVGTSSKDLLIQLKSINPLQEPTIFFNRFILTIAAYAAHSPAINDNKKIYYPILMKSLQKLSKAVEGSSRKVVMSSEILCETAASIVCQSSHSKYDCAFKYIPLCNAICDATQEPPLISVCLREPISYLRSKYLRTFIQRRNMQGERDLSPTEFILKQSKLETNYPGTSALTPAMHKEFIKQIQRHAFVKAFGFQELIASNDAFSLMGLQGKQTLP